MFQSIFFHFQILKLISQKNFKSALEVSDRALSVLDHMTKTPGFDSLKLEAQKLRANIYIQVNCLFLRRHEKVLLTKKKFPLDGCSKRSLG